MASTVEYSCTHLRERARRRPARRSGKLTTSSLKSLNSGERSSVRRVRHTREKDGEQYRGRRWRKDSLVQRYRGQYLGCEPKGLILTARSSVMRREVTAVLHVSLALSAVAAVADTSSPM